MTDDNPIFVDPETISCFHQFVPIQQITRPDKVMHERYIDIHGCQAGCVHCGQVRTVWETGEITLDHADPKSTR